MTHGLRGKSGSWHGNVFDRSSSEGRIERLLRGSQDALRFARQFQQTGPQRIGSRPSHYNPNQPRVPAGHPDGGQWTDVDAHAGRDDPAVLSDATPDNEWKPGARYANARRGSVPVRLGNRWVEVEAGQANRLTIAQANAQDAIVRVRQLDPSWRPAPSLSADPPQSIEGLIRRYESEAEQALGRLGELARLQAPLIIPRSRPSTAQERHEVVREIARWLVKNRGCVIEGVTWLLEHESIIESYLDPPKTLEELQRGAATLKRGYDIHHIVERSSAEQDGFPRSMIDGPENLVRVPRLRHWEITGWYQRSNDLYEGLSPSSYLRGKDWTERFAIGLKALKEYGVLKP